MTVPLTSKRDSGTNMFPTADSTCFILVIQGPVYVLLHYPNVAFHQPNGKETALKAQVRNDIVPLGHLFKNK
jgi:hypothetical protein